MSVRYCSNCGIRIDPQDFVSGGALRDGANTYCARCALSFIPEKKAEAHPVQPQLRGHGQIIKRHPPGTAGWQKRERGSEHEVHYPQPAAKKGSPALLVGVLAAVVLLIVIIIVISASDRRTSYRETASVEEHPRPVRPVAEKPRIDEPRKVVLPARSPAEKRLEEALAYAKSHPEEFEKIIDILEAIEQEEAVGDELAARIGRHISELMGRWEVTARRIWDNAMREAEAAERSGDVPKAISVYESLPAVCSNLPAYSAKVKEEVERLRSMLGAKEAFSQIEPLLSQIDSARELEELKRMREQIAEFCARYEDTEYAKKLKEPLQRLNGVIADLERKTYEDEQKTRDEEERRKQEEITRQEAQKRANEWQQQKAHLEKFWAQNNFDAGALPELQAGRSYRLFNGADSNGWLQAGTRDCNWSVQGGEIVGSNSSKDQPGLLFTNYRRQYFWENYTLECKACVTRGMGAISVRANVDANNKLGGTSYTLNQNQWVSIKMVVKDDEVSISVDGAAPATHRGNTWQAGFVVLAVEQGAEVRFKDLILQLDSVKPPVR